jgi:hypothetical protein
MFSPSTHLARSLSFESFIGWISRLIKSRKAPEENLVRMYAIMIQQWDIGGAASPLCDVMSRSMRGLKLLARLQHQLCHTEESRAHLNTLAKSKSWLPLSPESLLRGSTFTLPRRRNNSSKHHLSGSYAAAIVRACRRLFSDFDFELASGDLPCAIIYGSVTINGSRRRSSKMERPLSEVGYSQSSCFIPTSFTSAYTPLGFDACAARILYCLMVQPVDDGPVWVVLKCRLFSATDTKCYHYDTVNHLQPDHITDLFLPLWCVGKLVSIAPHPLPALKDTGFSVIIPIKN